MIDIVSIRDQFPILKREINGKPLVYLDNAATTQKPQSVLDAITHYYATYNANVHRGIHTLSQEATTAMEESRTKIQAFVNAAHAHEINFTYGTTDGINTVAYALRERLKEGDEILISEMEHHSNIVPWHLLAKMTGAVIRYIPLDENGTLSLDHVGELLNEKTKIVAVNQISNALGVENPIAEIIEQAHAVGAWVLIDGAQAVPHLAVDVQAMDADFYVFSGHKMYGPTGTGILYAKESIMQDLAPFRGGGEMIEEVFMTQSTYAGLPFRYEAGTPNICGNIALGAAVDFMQSIGLENIAEHEQKLLVFAQEKLSEIPSLEIYAKEAAHRAGAISFNLNLKGVHPSDVGMILDKIGIAVRTGQHCCQPIMDKYGVPGTVRASFAVYNTQEEITALAEGVKRAAQMLG